jgi:CRISPR-associated protein Cas2
VTVIVVERVALPLRGELSKWMLQIGTGVFVGKLSIPVRSRLWRMACSRSGSGSVVMVERTDGEQGYTVRFWGTPRYVAEDYEGLLLVRERFR